MVDNTKDKDKQDSKDEEDDETDYSITTSKAKVPEINLFGIKVKLDTLTLAAAALGTVAAGGVGYLLYDQFNKNKAIEEQRKAYENQERQRQQAVFNQYVNDQAPVQQAKPRHVPVPLEDDSGLVDMDNYYNPADEIEPKQDLEKILNHTNNPYQRVAAPKLASKYVPISNAVSEENEVVDMDQYIDTPEAEIAPTVPQKKRKRAQPEQEFEEQGPTEEELYASMNNNTFY